MTVQQLRAIEINPYAYELAQACVQIGWLQWRRENGFDNDRTPVLQNLDGFENKDALLNETFHKKPKNLKAAQAEEHGVKRSFSRSIRNARGRGVMIIRRQSSVSRRQLMRRELGDGYVDELFEISGERIPGS